ncbi:MAG: sugar phosphate isomerase/epimerase [Actinomycetaceae bacterium]|jgi:sugar phosphate isomerase/epimerase|nr:sugar phosphate isomerase/epimerase [Actinomycetaceae bacterium]
MKDDLHNYIRPGIIHFMAYPFASSGDGPIAESVERIVNDDFFEAIEITRINGAKERAAVKKLIDTAGMTVGFGAQPYILKQGLNLSDFDEEKRLQTVEVLKGAVDQAYEMGAKKFGFLSGPKPKDKRDTDRALERLAQSIIEIGRYAKSKGDILLSLETFDDSTEKFALIGTNRLGVELAREVRKAIPDFGLMVDLSHLPMQGETVREAMTVTAEYLNHAHIGTCVISDPDDPAYGDKHPYFSHPKSECHVPEVREFLAGLFDIGYLREDAPERNIVSFEVQPLGDEKVDGVIADAKRVLREAWRLL